PPGPPAGGPGAGGGRRGGGGALGRDGVSRCAAGGGGPGRGPGDRPGGGSGTGRRLGGRGGGGHAGGQGQGRGRGRIRGAGLPWYATDPLRPHPGRPTADLLGERDQAARRPWAAADHPRIAGWLAANEKPLDAVTEAAGRAGWYFPVVSAKADGEGWYGLVG